MDFSWLKKLFNKKKSTGIAKIDTSFINVPKLSELQEENKKIALSYLSDMNLDNYESIVKYSESLVDKTNENLALLFNKTKEFNELISSIKPVNETKYNHNLYWRGRHLHRIDYYFQIIVDVDYLKEQIKLLINEIRNTEIQCELRLIAFNEFIKRESRQKYDLLGIFGNAERLKYLRHKNSLLGEKERLLVTTKIIRDNLLSACAVYNQCDYNNNEKLKEVDYYVEWGCHSETIKNLGFGGTTPVTRDFDCTVGILNVISRINIRRGIIYDHDRKFGQSLDHYYKQINNDNKTTYVYHKKNYRNALKNLAFINVKIDEYAYHHRNDYKTIISEINELITEYRATISNKWDIKKLRTTILCYLFKVTNYIIVCNNFINDNIIKELKERLFHLNYFLYISKIEQNKNNSSMSSRDKIHISSEYTWLIGTLKDIEEWKWEDEKECYNELSYELLNTVSILNLSIYDYKKIKKNENIIINELIHNEELPYLYDLYNQSFIDENIDIVHVNECILTFDKYNLYLNDSVHPSDLFYIAKLVNIKDNQLNELLFNNNFKIKIKENNDIKSKIINELAVKSIFNYLEKNYDERIVVIPRDVFSIGYKDGLLNKALIDIIYFYHEKEEAIYVSDVSLLSKISNSLMLLGNNIKYIMILKSQEEVLLNNLNIYASIVGENHDYIKIHGDNRENIKIILLPDDVKITELSNYLDKVKELETKDEKVLRKRN